MKYKIYGFLQDGFVKFGLKSSDMLILRWFVDFMDSGRMISKEIDGKLYYWIDYKKIMEDFPILDMKKDAIYMRLRKMCECKILERKILKKGGYSYYRLGDNYIYLIYPDLLTEEDLQNKDEAKLQDINQNIPKNTIQQENTEQDTKATQDTKINDANDQVISQSNTQDTQNNIDESQKQTDFFQNKMKKTSQSIEFYQYHADKTQKKSELSQRRADFSQSKMKKTSQIAEFYPNHADKYQEGAGFYPNQTDSS